MESLDFIPLHNSLKGVTAAELMKMDIPEPKWAVPEILPEGCIILAGRPKKGKSMLALNIGLQIASGEKVLGAIDVQRGTVIYFALEDTYKRLQKRIKTMLQGKDAPDKLVLHRQISNMYESGLALLEEEIKKYDDLRLVIIDTLKKFNLGKKRRSKILYDEDYNDISQIKALADKHNVCILLIHHVRKQESDEGDIMDTISGTFGLTGGADGSIVLKRSDHRSAVLYVIGRDVLEAQHILEYDPDSMSWEMAGEAKDKKSTQMKQKVYDTIKNSSSPLSPSDIAKFTGYDAQYVKNVLPKLIDEGGIVKVDRGQYAYIENKSLP